MFALSIDVKYDILPEHGHVVQQTYFSLTLFTFGMFVSPCLNAARFSPPQLCSFLFPVLSICRIDNGKGCSSFL